MCINTTPLGSHKILGDYAVFTVKRFILVQLHRGSNEVHIIFDNPGQLERTPKQFEQSRRDKAAKVSPDHCCDEFHNTKIPCGKWRETFLNCRACKRNLVKFLGKYILDSICKHLQSHQTVYY